MNFANLYCNCLNLVLFRIVVRRFASLEEVQTTNISAFLDDGSSKNLASSNGHEVLGNILGALRDML